MRNAAKQHLHENECHVAGRLCAAFVVRPAQDCKTLCWAVVALVSSRRACDLCAGERILSMELFFAQILDTFWAMHVRGSELIATRASLCAARSLQNKLCAIRELLFASNENLWTNCICPRSNHLNCGCRLHNCSRQPGIRHSAQNTCSIYLLDEHSLECDGWGPIGRCYCRSVGFSVPDKNIFRKNITCGSLVGPVLISPGHGWVKFDKSICCL